MEEYLIVEGTRTDIQTKLNQWRHDYSLKIIHFVPSGTSHLDGSKLYTVMIIRIKKDGK
jgi:hypothetical protein